MFVVANLLSVRATTRQHARQLGRWHGAARAAEFSVEQGLAETLSLKLGDRLIYDIAGNRVEAVITSMRKLDWDSMRVNFFVMSPPGVLENFPVSYITSFHLPAEQAGAIPELVRAFPNLTVIDVAALVRQLHATIDQVSRAVQLVFGFAVLAEQGTLPAPDDVRNIVGTRTGLYLLLLLATLLLGSAEVLRDNCGQTFMPSIVAPEHLERANGRMWSIESVANTFIGPPILSTSFDSTSIFALPADSFSFALILVRVISNRLNS